MNLSKHNSVLLLFFANFFVFVFLESRAKAQLDFNKAKQIQLPKTVHQCKQTNSFVWCLPMAYNKDDEPWKDILIKNSTLPWNYNLYYDIIEVLILRHN